MQPLFGTKIRIDIDALIVHDPVVLRVIIKKCRPRALQTLLHLQGNGNGAAVPFFPIAPPFWSFSSPWVTRVVAGRVAIVTAVSHADLGLVTVEQHEISMYDHMTVEDLKVRVCGVLKGSTNPDISKLPITPDTVQIKVNVSQVPGLLVAVSYPA